MRVRVSLSVLLAIAGCSQPQEAQQLSISAIEISINAKPDQNLLSAEAFTEPLYVGATVWLVAGGHISIVDNAKYTFSCTDDNLGPFIAWTNETGIRINCIIFNTYDGITRERIIAHEIGHLQGLGHVPEPEAVMYGQTETGLGPVITKYDIAEYDRIHQQYQ